MKLIQKILAVIFLSIGGPISGLCIVSLIFPGLLDDGKEDQKGVVGALIFFGLPPLTLGGSLMLNLNRQHRLALTQATHQQEQLFLQILQNHQGVITVIEYATEAQIPLDQATVYLNQKAIQLNADFSTTESGAIIYRFPL
jgi:hypothetical protein